MPEEPRRSRYSGFLFAVGILSATGYLTYAAIQGEYGLVRLIGIQTEEQLLAEKKSALLLEKNTLRNKVDRLSLESLDLDLLDERARSVLGYAHPSDIILN
jgi:cell division protein FtsB